MARTEEGLAVQVEPGLALIENAIGMTRFPYGVTRDGAAAAISPDGSKVATMVWRGDLERNVNIYSLLVIDVAESRSGPRAKPVPILSVDFSKDSEEYFATPFSQVTFAGDSRTITFLGTLNGEPRQVYTVDVETAECRKITDHADGISTFALRPDGSLAVYGIPVAGRSDGREELAHRDGVLVMDRDLFPERPAFKSSSLALWPDGPRRAIQYLLASDDDEPKLVFDSRRSGPTPVNGQATTSFGALAPVAGLDDEYMLRAYGSLTTDPTGRHALLWPYALASEPVQAERYAHYHPLEAFRLAMAAPYGLIDLSSGAIEQFLAAPHPAFDPASGGPVWAPDGRSVLVYTLLPFTDDDGRAGEEPPRWVEIDLETRRIRSLALPPDWRVLAWNQRDDGPIVARDRELAIVSRGADGSWGDLHPLGTTDGFQQRFPNPVTDGRLIVGRIEAPREPPELGIEELPSGSLTLATDLNSELRTQEWPEVEEIEWNGHLTASTGYLVKPYAYEAGERYPLAILFDDGLLRDASPFLLDGGGVHLSGHPIQALAARGIAVLYARTSEQMHDLINTADEGDHILDHVESAIAYLDGRGLIDPARVGLSGWSYAAYKTDYTLIHSSHRFAAATHIDIDPVDIPNGRRPFSDERLSRIRTPLLFEAHGRHTYISTAATADRLNALGGAAEILYFPTATHSVIAPRHRLRSLGVHLDWFCFWLNDEVDPDPVKKGQYERWYELRARLGP